jgi:putative intracellular protease/amidase
MKTIINLCLWAIVSGLILTASQSAEPAKKYVCPSCGCAADGRTFDKPGTCPDCGMALIEKVDNPQQKQQMTVAVLLFDGAEVIDYAGPWEVFGQAGFKIFTVAENSKPINAVFGQKLIPDYTFGNAPVADILLVPGGRGTRTTMNNPVAIKWVQHAAQTSNQVMSVCTGALILGKAGLLDGLTATTFHNALDLLANTAPKTRVVNNQRYVDNGKIITTAGLSSGIDGALHLVSKLKGKGFAQVTALGLEYQWDPTGKFARAALADRYFPDLDGVDGDVISSEGDTNHWQTQALLSKPASAAAILDLLAKRVAENTPHAQGAVIVDRAIGGTGERGTAMQWNFTSDDGRRWTGRALVEPSTEKPQKFLLSLKLDGQAKANQL